MDRRKRIDFFALVVWSILVALFSLSGLVSYFGSVILFLILPSVFLSFRATEHVKSAAIFSIFSIPVIIVVTITGYLSHLWVEFGSFFPFMVLGLMTVETILWSYFTFYYVILFYKHFTDNGAVRARWNLRTKLIFWAPFLILALFLAMLYSNPSLLNIDNFYLKFAVPGILIPFLISLIWKPKETSKLFFTTAFFFFLHFLYEIVALRSGWWMFFESEYVGWITMLGVGFPVEEFIFWFMLLSPVIIIFYRSCCEENPKATSN